MAYYFITASKDASIYLQQPDQNTGLDEILDISKVYFGNIKDISRALIKFDLDALAQSISNGDVVIDSVKLSLRETESQEIPLRYTILAHPISGSWEMGNGTRFDKISTTGVNWKYREGDSKVDWLPNELASGSDSNPNDGTGGTWYTASAASQSFNYESSDLNIDVKNTVNLWLSGSLPNDGFILKHTNEYENDTNDYGILKFFGKETNTIYQPKLVITYPETNTSGSLIDITNFAASSSYDVVYRCYSPNLKDSYTKGQKVSVKVDARELYPIKQFNSTFAYQVKYYLPNEAYYAVMDTLTKEFIINYSPNTKVLRGLRNNMINLNFTNWPIGRNYTLFVKSIDTNNEEIFEIGSFDIYE
jgi:hypothetical protein